MKNKKNRKHLMALLLSAAMLFSILPVNAAETEIYGQDITAGTESFVNDGEDTAVTDRDAEDQPIVTDQDGEEKPVVTNQDGDETGRKDISTCTIMVSPDDYVYDGTAKTPIVTAQDGQEVLERGVDYTVRYEDNVEPGIAKIIIRGIGRYRGEVIKTFVITEYVPSGKIRISACTITVIPGAYTYDGTEKRPAVTVRNENTFLVKDTDYTVRYENNINVGRASIIIAGTGNYWGTVTRYFVIIKAPQTGVTAKGTQTITGKTSYTKKVGDKAFYLNAKRTSGDGALIYTSFNERVVKVNRQGKVTIKGAGAAIIQVKVKETVKYKETSVKILIWVKPVKQKISSLEALDGGKFKVSWKKDEKAVGYEIQYSTDRTFNKKKNIQTKIIKKKQTGSVTIRNLKAGKTYYVRVRTYKRAKVNGVSRKLYGAWSSKKSVKIRQ